MKSKKMYVVATSNNLQDVRVHDIFDGEVFTLETILAGLRKKLKLDNIQVSIIDDNAYIDVIDDNGELNNTYSIISKTTFIK